MSFSSPLNPVQNSGGQQFEIVTSEVVPTKSPLNIIYTSGHYGDAKIKEQNFDRKYRKIIVFGFNIPLVCQSVILRAIL